MGLDILTLSITKKYTDEKIEEVNVSGGGLTSQEKADLEKNTEARHIHSNKDVLDYFDMNYDKTRPTFKSNDGITNTLATLDDVSLRIATLRDNLENQISTIPKFSIKVVDTLPTENISNMTVYLLKDTETDGNLYTEYIYINNTWEVLGSQQIDLTDYVKSEDVSTEIEAVLAEAKASGEFDGADGQNGKDGQNGQDGADGLSAYQIWLNAGNTGTEAVFLASLKGADGPKGDTGPQGEKGDTGAQGPKGETGAMGPEGPQGIQGEKGETGTTGKDGTSVTVTKVSESAVDSGNNIVTFSDGKTLTIKNGSKGSKGDKGDTGETGPQGIQGEKGADGAKGDKGDKGDAGTNGKDGVSATHSWNGTTLTITSASGTSSANLKGETGASGSNGRDGSNGADGVGIKSVVQTTTSSADGGSNIITVTKTDNTTSTFTVKNGSKGSKGDKGDTGATGSKGADGHTPIKGTDYFTEADKAEINAENIAFISAELAKRGQLKPEFAENLEWLKENGDTSKMYVMPDGFIYGYMPVTGTTQGSEKLTVAWYENNRLSTSDGGLRSGASGYAASERIDLSILKNVGDTLTVEGLNFNGTNYQSRSIAGFADNAFISAYYPSTTATFPIGNSGVTIKNLNSSQNVVTLEKVADSDGKTYEVAFCGYGSGTNAVVTYTGEVEMDGVMMWCNTGHAFVPADYEDRIISLEKDNKILKTDNESLKTRVKALEDAAIYDEGIPSYVLTEAEEVADKVLSVRNADSFVMGLVSDLHTNGTDTSSVGVLHAGQGIDIINSLTQFDLVALLGDYEIYGFSYGEGDTDGEDARVSFKHAKRCFNSVAKGVPFIMLQGNHDELPADTTEEARQKYYAYIGANNLGTVVDYDNKFRNYGYRDFENYQIRVIYLNSTDVSDNAITANCHISTEQLNWLNTVALKLPNEDWLPIVLSHHPLNWSGMSSILDALNTYKGTDKSVIHFHGHLHNFRAETLGTNSVPTITIPNACFGRNNEYGTSSSYDETTRANFGDIDENGNQRQFNKTANTAEDTAFNVVVIDREKRKIHCFNYGAGIDREISY